MIDLQNKSVSYEILATVFDNSAVGVTVHRGFDILYANNTIAHLLKYKSAVEFINVGSLASHIPKRRCNEVSSRWASIENGRLKPERNRVSNLTKDGDEIWLDISDERIIWEDEKPATLSIIHDVSSAVKTNANLISSLRHLEISLDSILEFIPFGIATFSDVGEAKTVNSAMRLLFQASPQQNDYVPVVMRELIAALVNSDETELIVKAVETRVDKVVDLIARKMADDTILLSAADVSDWKDTQDKLKRMAERDVLTKLLNRRGFADTVRPILRNSSKKTEAFALIVADIDFFKSINDTHGHAVGDEALKAFSKRLSAALRPKDILARVGGEEFAIFLPRTNGRKAELVAQRLRKTIEKNPLGINGITINLTASFGLTICEDGEESKLSDLMQSADAALYRAKNTGRNRVSLA